jgi:hypothetical protein
MNIKNITCNGLNQNDISVCSGNGNCLNNKCECFFGYFGNNCELTTCYDIEINDETVCSGNGICTNLNKCLCNKKYSGDNCEIYSCHDFLYNDTNVCKGKGKCTFPDNCECNNKNIIGFKCESCVNGYYGEDCNYNICNGTKQEDPTVCYGRGKCIFPNICSCNNNRIVGSNCEKCIEGKDGYNCNLIKCGGILSDDPAVCNRRGNCTLTNKCK